MCHFYCLNLELLMSGIFCSVLFIIYNNAFWNWNYHFYSYSNLILILYFRKRNNVNGAKKNLYFLGRVKRKESSEPPEVLRVRECRGARQNKFDELNVMVVVTAELVDRQQFMKDMENLGRAERYPEVQLQIKKVTFETVTDICSSKKSFAKLRPFCSQKLYSFLIV